MLGFRNPCEEEDLGWGKQNSQVVQQYLSTQKFLVNYPSVQPRRQGYLPLHCYEFPLALHPGTASGQMIDC